MNYTNRIGMLRELGLGRLLVSSDIDEEHLYSTNGFRDEEKKIMIHTGDNEPIIFTGQGVSLQIPFEFFARENVLSGDHQSIGERYRVIQVEMDSATSKSIGWDYYNPHYTRLADPHMFLGNLYFFNNRYFSEETG
jgi:hypothetical protein